MPIVAIVAPTHLGKVGIKPSPAYGVVRVERWGFQVAWAPSHMRLRFGEKGEKRELNGRDLCILTYTRYSTVLCIPKVAFVFG